MSLLSALVLAAVTVTVNPPQPKVGDLITIDFAAPVTLEASQEYEVVSRQGKRVVVRTFEPKPFVMSGAVGNERFTNLVVPVGSVLAPNDTLAPAPLAPPLSVPYPRAPFIAIAIAALAAFATWLAVGWRAKHATLPAVATPQLSAEERFRNAVIALRRNGAHPRRWAALADETRAFLAATRQLGKELTTYELVPRLSEHDAVVVDILRHGDYEKFAPAGEPQADFEEVAQRALVLTEARA
ncbi:MAG TPA: hypothetical protein VEK79_15675 [Thermoanaerobaculia bacterium]|nr:hypothetical protein [Thermoanaerobaculia bacterium]